MAQTLSYTVLNVVAWWKLSDQDLDMVKSVLRGE